MTDLTPDVLTEGERLLKRYDEYRGGEIGGYEARYEDVSDFAVEHLPALIETVKRLERENEILVRSVDQWRELVASNRDMTKTTYAHDLNGEISSLSSKVVIAKKLIEGSLESGAMVDRELSEKWLALPKTTREFTVAAWKERGESAEAERDQLAAAVKRGLEFAENGMRYAVLGTERWQTCRDLRNALGHVVDTSDALGSDE